MGVVIWLVGFFCGFSLCSMIALMGRLEVEDDYNDKTERINLTRGYLQVLRTGDLELTKEEMIDSIEKVLEGKE